MGRIGGLTVSGPRDPSRRASVVSFLVEGMDPVEAGDRLEKRFGILVRSGLHCSPNSHRTLGAFTGGAGRVSPGAFPPPTPFPFQSPPFTRTWGTTSRRSAAGVSPENTATNETHDSDANR